MGNVCGFTEMLSYSKAETRPSRGAPLATLGRIAPRGFINICQKILISPFRPGTERRIYSAKGASNLGASRTSADGRSTRVLCEPVSAGEDARRRCILQRKACVVSPLVAGAVRNAVGIRRGAFSGNMKVSFQAARSIG